jgi:hypothetical protein
VPGAAVSSGQEDATSDSADNPILLGTSLFFARVPPTVSYESIMELFAQFGTVLTLNLFRPWATAKTSKVRFFFFVINRTASTDDYAASPYPERVLAVRLSPGCCADVLKCSHDDCALHASSPKH